MVFSTDAEIWKYLLAGGIVRPRVSDGKSRTVRLVRGLKTFSNGESARGVLLTPSFWVGINTREELWD